MPFGKSGFHYAVKNSADAGEIYIYGIIGADWWTGQGNTAKSFLRDFKQLEEKYNTIHVHINSPGGDVWEGIPIANAIRSSKKDVHTWVDGIAFSMGAIIAIAGKTVHIASNGLLMIHNASSLAWGNAKDLRKAADELDKYDSALSQTISDKTGLSLDDVKAKWMDYSDHYFTASEALAEKLVDVVESYQGETPDNVQNLKANEVFAIYSKLDKSEEKSFMERVTDNVRKAIFGNGQPKNTAQSSTTMNFQKSLDLLKKDNLTAEERQAITAEITAFTGANEKFTKDELDAKVKDATNALNQQVADLQKQLKEAQEAAKKVADEFEAFKKSSGETTYPNRKGGADPERTDPKNEFRTPEDDMLEELRNQGA
jgi:ATP-dependent Clp protease protease subunit